MCTAHLFLLEPKVAVSWHISLQNNYGVLHGVAPDEVGRARQVSEHMILMTYITCALAGTSSRVDYNRHTKRVWDDEEMKSWEWKKSCDQKFEMAQVEKVEMKSCGNEWKLHEMMKNQDPRTGNGHTHTQ